MKKIERDLQRELKNQTPDVWDKISYALPREQQAVTNIGTTVNRKTVAAVIPSVIAIITVAVLLLCLLIPKAQKPFTLNFGARAAITVDINPSVQINLDADGKVKSITPLNEDGKVLIAGKTDYIGLTGEEAAALVLDYALEIGYLSPTRTNNAMLVSAALADDESSEKYTKSVLSALKNEFLSKGVKGVVLSEVNDGSSARALKYGITVAKMKLIDNAVALGVSINESEYATITVSELNALIEARAEQLDKLPSDFEDEWEALEELSEQLCEDLADRAEELIESIEDLLGDENEDDDSDLELLLDALEDAIEALEDRAGADALQVISDMADRLTEYAPPELYAQVKDIVDDVKNELKLFEELYEEIQSQKNELISNRAALVEKFADELASYTKPSDFDDDFEDWYEDAFEDYTTNWQALYEQWLSSLPQ